MGFYCAQEILLQKAVDAAELSPDKKIPVLRGLNEWDMLAPGPDGGRTQGGDGAPGPGPATPDAGASMPATTAASA